MLRVTDVATGRLLLPVVRPAFLRDVGHALHQHPEMGDDVIACDVQRKYRRPPDLAHGTRSSKYR
jgi:hypothetical protein